MLPGFLAGHYTAREMVIDLQPLCEFANARFVQTSVEGIDLAKKTVERADGSSHEFDVVSIDTGSTPNRDSIPGAVEHAIGIKPIDRFIERWTAFEAEIANGPRQNKSVILVGGGVSGVESILSLQHRVTRLSNVRFTLVAGPDGIIPSETSRARDRLRGILTKRGIHIHEDRVTSVQADGVQCESGLRLTYVLLIWATQAQPASWLAETGLKTDERGFIEINDRLQSISHPFVFAAGDVASNVTHPRPKSGVFAVRQGPILTENLRHAICGDALGPFIPQEQFLKLISTGDQYAIASKGRLCVSGKWVWKWKRWIDRRFMRRYEALTSFGTRRIP